jgi:hypothetical protein
MGQTAKRATKPCASPANNGGRQTALTAWGKKTGLRATGMPKHKRGNSTEKPMEWLSYAGVLCVSGCLWLLFLSAAQQVQQRLCKEAKGKTWGRWVVALRIARRLPFKLRCLRTPKRK